MSDEEDACAVGRRKEFSMALARLSVSLELSSADSGCVVSLLSWSSGVSAVLVELKDFGCSTFTVSGSAFPICPDAVVAPAPFAVPFSWTAKSSKLPPESEVGERAAGGDGGGSAFGAEALDASGCEPVTSGGSSLTCAVHCSSDGGVGGRTAEGDEGSSVLGSNPGGGLVFAFATQNDSL